MANPFFSGRIPQSLADKIDSHLLTTGETRSELLVRLLRTEVDDNKTDNDNKADNSIVEAVSDLQQRVTKLEELLTKANNKIDNKIDNIKPKQTRSKKVIQPNPVENT
jgi:metal-responsive CopG/Arc/MetJ family transcriptional regulator